MTEKIINYPGFPVITGAELADRFREHMESLHLEITEKTVTSIMAAGNYYMVLADNEIYEARTLILAMGVMTARLCRCQAVSPSFCLPGNTSPVYFVCFTALRYFP